MFWPGLSPSASADVLPGFTSHITFKTEVSSAAVVSQQEDTGALAISNNFHSLLPCVLPLDTSTVKIDIEWKYRILIVKPLKKRYNPWSPWICGMCCFQLKIWPCEHLKQHINTASILSMNSLTHFHLPTDQHTLIYLFSVVLTCWVTLHPWWVKTDIHGANGPTACVHRRQSRVLVHQAGTGTHIHHQRQWTGNPGRDLPGRSIARHIHVYLALL